MRGLYLVTDRGLCGQRPLEEVVINAVKGGVAYVQLREKEISARLFVEEARKIKKLLEPYKAPLIINDRVDVALAVAAKGFFSTAAKALHKADAVQPNPVTFAIIG